MFSFDDVFVIGCTKTVVLTTEEKFHPNGDIPFQRKYFNGKTDMLVI